MRPRASPTARRRARARGDLAKHESYLSAAAENRRADIAAVPGSGPVRGVWAYDGVVYAFRDNDADPATKCVMHKSTASGWTAVALGKKIGFDAGTDKPASGTTIAGQTSGATASLVATLLASGSWTGDDAAGTFYLKTVSGTFQNDERLRIPADTELGTGYAKVANTDTPAAGKVARDSSVATKWRLRPKSGDTLATFAAIVAGTLVHVRIDASNYIALDVSAVSDDGTYLILDLTAAATTAGTVADDAAVSVRLKASPVAVADGVAGDIELDPGGRFEFRNHNFLGQSDTRYMYGVDGKNPAFEWDGTEYRPIVTGLLAGKEKPKHLAIQSEHLLLAYPGGSLQNSATGKPLDWTVTAGAAEIATGQEINGLVEGVGAGNTAVLGANRIQILYGTDKETWDLRDQSGEEAGAVEWSGQMMGEPVYMDNRGVRSIRSTPAYSNFNIGTMTYPVQPWLERQRAGGAVPVSSMRVRARDMYRVFFDTKIGLSIYFGRGKPECSLVELLHAVRCSCSFEADDGVERVFFGSDDGWVFEMGEGPILRRRADRVVRAPALQPRQFALARHPVSQGGSAGRRRGEGFAQGRRLLRLRRQPGGVSRGSRRALRRRGHVERGRVERLLLGFAARDGRPVPLLRDRLQRVPADLRAVRARAAARPDRGDASLLQPEGCGDEQRLLLRGILGLRARPRLREADRGLPQGGPGRFRPSCPASAS